MTESIEQRPCSQDFYNLQPATQRKYFKVEEETTAQREGDAPESLRMASNERARQLARATHKSRRGSKTRGEGNQGSVAQRCEQPPHKRQDVSSTLTGPTKEKPPVWKGGRTVTVTFDHLPPTELHPNYRKTNFWAVRAKVSKAAREEANLNANIHATFHYPIIQHCEITEIFTFPTKRRIDLEGCMVACKPYIDGFIDAGLLVDDDWKHVVKITGIPRYMKGKSQTEIVILEVV